MANVIGPDVAYITPLRKCPRCGQYVTATWLVRHRKSGCKHGNPNGKPYDVTSTEDRRKYVERELMQAAQAADALIHRLKAAGLLRPEDQAVCEQLVEAIGDGMQLGF